MARMWLKQGYNTPAVEQALSHCVPGLFGVIPGHAIMAIDGAAFYPAQSLRTYHSLVTADTRAGSMTTRLCREIAVVRG